MKRHPATMISIKKVIVGKPMWTGSLLPVVFLILMPPITWAEDFNWPDYREPFYGFVRVYQYGAHKIQSSTTSVNLPEDFLKDRKTICLAIGIVSRTSNYASNDIGFKDFMPTIRVNNKRYRIPVKGLPQVQTAEVKIKSKHLQAGRNTLTVSFYWKDASVACAGKGCGYDISKMHFKDAPPG